MATLLCWGSCAVNVPWLVQASWQWATLRSAGPQPPYDTAILSAPCKAFELGFKGGCRHGTAAAGCCKADSLVVIWGQRSPEAARIICRGMLAVGAD